MPAEIKSVVFDFDGVLIDSVDLKFDAMKECYADFGEDFADHVLAYHKEHHTTRYVTAEYVMEKQGISDPNFVEERAKMYSKLVEDKIVKMPLYPGADSVIMEVGKRMPIFISTGTPEEEINKILRKKCMRHLFDAVFGSPDKKEQHFEKILKSTGLPPRNVLFIGDMPSDYHVSQNVKVNFLGYNFRGKEDYPDVEHVDKLLNVLDYIESRKANRWKW